MYVSTLCACTSVLMYVCTYVFDGYICRYVSVCAAVCACMCVCMSMGTFEGMCVCVYKCWMCLCGYVMRV